MGPLMDKANLELEQVMGIPVLVLHCGFYGLQEKEKSLGNTLQLSLACWWDSSKTQLPAQASQTGLGHGFCPWPLVQSSQKRGNSSANDRIKSGEPGLTSQEPEHGWIGGIPTS